jgi:glycerol-3-phosphate cytidylyltransferase-like family protein
LNKFKNVKDFLKNPGHIDQYPDIKIRWIGGANPDLVIFGEDEKEKERIDLTAYRSIDALHELVRTKGFQKKGGDCVGTGCDAEL